LKRLFHSEESPAKSCRGAGAIWYDPLKFSPKDICPTSEGQSAKSGKDERTSWAAP
jgi:hypothetical protein